MTRITKPRDSGGFLNKKLSFTLFMIISIAVIVTFHELYCLKELTEDSLVSNNKILKLTEDSLVSDNKTLKLAEDSLVSDNKILALLSSQRDEEKKGHQSSSEMSIDEWAKGIDFEVDHHTAWLRGDLEMTNHGWYKYEKETKLEGKPINPHQKWICGLFSQVYGADKVAQKVKFMIDHGAGPFTNLGVRFNCDYEDSSIHGVDAQVVAYDPLAPQYNELLSKFEIHNTLRTSFCPSENLAKCTGKEVADFAIIINALDHSRDPLHAFKQSLQSVKVGGLSCVFTKLNEANTMGGAGFHQWNFDLNESGDWVIENFQTHVKTNVDEAIKGSTKRIVLDESIGSSDQKLICFKKTKSIDV